ncbi:NAD kinase [uncultured Jatrophihabitans sp.]|uniref:NAD kinase n=1 Tax=uncultured Jatrophihabitans sp. TaxID=1610747 RepID=UPI0035C9C387
MRTVLLVAHAARRKIVDLASQVIDELSAADVTVRMLRSEALECRAAAVDLVDDPAGTGADAGAAAAGCELVLVLGGDGTFLRAAELARPAGVPMLGVNLGHVGFLAEAEPAALNDVIDAVVKGTYTVEERVTIEADIITDGPDGEIVRTAWALNEASLERTNRERMLEIAVAVDDRPLLRFGCDGLICATPTGSTAYAFSTGGPIIWPDLEALLIVPNAAHALFARPIVVAPSSTVDVDLVSAQHEAMLSCDGRRSFDVPAGARVRLRLAATPVKVAGLGLLSFPDRLVSRFQLPVRSLREAAASAGDDD